MPKFPDYIEIPAAKAAQNFCIGTGCFFGLVAFGAFSNGEAGGGLACGAIAFVLFCIAGNIKTKKYFRGGAGLYE